MFGLLRRLMNGFINLVDKIKCNLGCCTNNVYVTIPCISQNAHRNIPVSREVTLDD